MGSAGIANPAARQVNVLEQAKAVFSPVYRASDMPARLGERIIQFRRKKEVPTLTEDNFVDFMKMLQSEQAMSG